MKAALKIQFGKARPDWREIRQKKETDPIEVASLQQAMVAEVNNYYTEALPETPLD